jgi:hypothetical protein
MKTPVRRLEEKKTKRRVYERGGGDSGRAARQSASDERERNWRGKIESDYDLRGIRKDAGTASHR